MSTRLPAIIVTGASGIVGRNFLETVKNDFLIYAIARKPQKEAGVPDHPNIKWIQVDIANLISLRGIMHNIKREGGADYLLHLAGYYDFDYGDHPEYQRTNIDGMRNILEQAKILRIKRFIFASSTAGAPFSATGEKISEKTPLSAEYPYAVSKRKGEEMVEEYSRHFPCSIVRFAAVVTDWCEYGPLYMFLKTWLSRNLKNRILGGRGESAVSYIHTHDLCKLLLTIIRKSSTLPEFNTYVAGPVGSTSHRELFEIATRFFYRKEVKPILIPKFIAYPGILVMDFLGRLIGRRPFERPWMLKYVDLKLATDSSYTQQALTWRPAPRYNIRRRLLFMIEKMKSDPYQWDKKNTSALKKVTQRPNLQIYEAMQRNRGKIMRDIEKTLLSPHRLDDFPGYIKMDRENFRWVIGVFFQLLSSSVRDNDRMLLFDYIRDLASIRIKEGFSLKEICLADLEIGEIIIFRLIRDTELKGMEQLIHDYIILTIQLTLDEIEDVYEKSEGINIDSDEDVFRTIDAKIRELETFYRSPDENRTAK